MNTIIEMALSQCPTAKEAIDFAIWMMESTSLPLTEANAKPVYVPGRINIAKRKNRYNQASAKSLKRGSRESDEGNLVDPTPDQLAYYSQIAAQVLADRRANDQIKSKRYHADPSILLPQEGQPSSAAARYHQNLFGRIHTGILANHEHFLNPDGTNKEEAIRKALDTFIGMADSTAARHERFNRENKGKKVDKTKKPPRLFMPHVGDDFKSNFMEISKARPTLYRQAGATRGERPSQAGVSPDAVLNPLTKKEQELYYGSGKGKPGLASFPIGMKAVSDFIIQHGLNDTDAANTLAQGVLTAVVKNKKAARNRQESYKKQKELIDQALKQANSPTLNLAASTRAPSIKSIIDLDYGRTPLPKRTINAEPEGTHYSSSTYGIPTDSPNLLADINKGRVQATNALQARQELQDLLSQHTDAILSGDKEKLTRLKTKITNTYGSEDNARRQLRILHSQPNDELKAKADLKAKTITKLHQKNFDSHKADLPPNTKSSEDDLVIRRIGPATPTGDIMLGDPDQVDDAERFAKNKNIVDPNKKKPGEAPKKDKKQQDAERKYNIAITPSREPDEAEKALRQIAAKHGGSVNVSPNFTYKKYNPDGTPYDSKETENQFKAIHDREAKRAQQQKDPKGQSIRSRLATPGPKSSKKPSDQRKLATIGQAAVDAVKQNDNVKMPTPEKKESKPDEPPKPKKS